MMIPQPHGTHRTTLTLALLLSVGLTACGATGPAPPTHDAGGALNVILVMTDDQGWGDLSLHGNPALQTPHLDQLASESVQLQHFYVHPVCTPTRAALAAARGLSSGGRQPPRFEFW